MILSQWSLEMVNGDAEVSGQGAPFSSFPETWLGSPPPSPPPAPHPPQGRGPPSVTVAELLSDCHSMACSHLNAVLCGDDPAASGLVWEGQAGPRQLAMASSSRPPVGGTKGQHIGIIFLPNLGGVSRFGNSPQKCENSPRMGGSSVFLHSLFHVRIGVCTLP